MNNSTNIKLDMVKKTKKAQNQDKSFPTMTGGFID